MAKIGDIDRNLKVSSSIKKDGLALLDVNKKPFSVFGVYNDGKGFTRMDSSVAKNISDGVYYLHRNTSGGRVTFETDSPYVSVSYKGNKALLPHMPLTGSAGFDLYFFENGEFRYYKTFVPSTDKKKKYESIIEFPDKKMRKILIHFPLYSNVDSLMIGLDRNSQLNEFNPYNDKAPIVYYGSSITQGACASRPGNNYPAIVSQKNLTDFLCLGFSGNAHGEEIMAEYISDLPMSAFVLDYDYNDASNPERLREKHYPFYKKIREKNKELPIIMMSAPYSLYFKPTQTVSKKIVEESFRKARETDKNVYYIDGRKMLGEEFIDCATVDGCHPNDYGFVKMAQAVLNTLKEIQNSPK